MYHIDWLLRQIRWCFNHRKFDACACRVAQAWDIYDLSLVMSRKEMDEVRYYTKRLKERGYVF